ncbi:metal-binding protein [Motilimonas cestriensis]|uniref:metal-binding protein n=1 Tax=Motilimonas cestriensis TaxID=2742685 RepID=UPI003DA4BEBE
MGNYSKNISKRFAHTRIKQGYCLICGSFGRLSPDHVPPKGAITITKVEQRHISEVIGMVPSDVKGVPSPNGSKFKTICHECNNSHLGGNDGEVARVCKYLTLKIQDYFRYVDHPYNFIVTDVDSIKFARAMVGHILAATSIEECKKPPEYSPYFQPLKNFVLGDNSALNDSHDIYYWFYPFKRHVSAKCVAFYNEGHLSLISLLSFFPIAFMITKKNEGTYPAHASKLTLGDERLVLDLSSLGYSYSAFPFHGLKGNQMYALTDFQTIVSYPIGQ